MDPCPESLFPTSHSATWTDAVTQAAGSSLQQQQQVLCLWGRNPDPRRGEVGLMLEVGRLSGAFDGPTLVHEGAECAGLKALLSDRNYCVLKTKLLLMLSVQQRVEGRTQTYSCTDANISWGVGIGQMLPDFFLLSLWEEEEVTGGGTPWRPAWKTSIWSSESLYRKRTESGLEFPFSLENSRLDVVEAWDLLEGSTPAPHDRSEEITSKAFILQQLGVNIVC